MVREDFVEKRIVWEYFYNLVGVDHPACCLLRQYRNRRAPVVFTGQWCTEGQGSVALYRGPYQPTMAHVPFLWD